MNKKCLFCQSLTAKAPLNEWIKENQFSGPHGQILKEIYVGNIEPEPNDREPINTVYYCSWECLNLQLAKEEKEDFNKGFCEQCGEYLVVLNEQCQDEKHKQEAHYYRLKGESK